MPTRFDVLGQKEPVRSSVVRRDFLKHSLATAATLGVAAGESKRFAVAAEPQSSSAVRMFKVVDTHQHLWDLKRFRLPWTANSPSLARLSMRDYPTATAGIPIEKSVYLEVDVAAPAATSRSGLHHRAVPPRRGTARGAVISGRPSHREFPRLHRPVQGSSVRPWLASGVARRIDSAGILSAKAVSRRHPKPGRAEA